MRQSEFQKEQLRLLNLILGELQKINEQLALIGRAPGQFTEPQLDTEDETGDELESFE